MWNLRTKTPNNEQTTVPWHQDNAYMDADSLYTLMPTAWIPLIDANKTNGCMQVSEVSIQIHCLMPSTALDGIWRPQARHHGHSHLLCWSHLVRRGGGEGDGESSGCRPAEGRGDL